MADQYPINFDWNPATGGSTEQQYSRNVYGNAEKMMEMFANFNSPYYTAFANYINKATPGIGAGSFLSLLQSSGGNYAGSMAQALQLKSQADKQRRDTINTGLLGYASNTAQMLPQLLGIQANVAGNQLTNQTNKEIAQMQEGGWLDSLGGILGTVGGIALAPMTGGFSMLAPMAMQAGRR